MTTTPIKFSVAVHIAQLYAERLGKAERLTYSEFKLCFEEYCSIYAAKN